MKLYEEFKLFETMWDVLTERTAAVENEFIDVVLSIDDRADFVKHIKDIYDSMPVDVGFWFIGKPSRTLIKQANGALAVYCGHQCLDTITDPNDAIAALRTAAGKAGTIIHTCRLYPSSQLPEGIRIYPGTRLINKDGSHHIVTYNKIIPQRNR